MPAELISLTRCALNRHPGDVAVHNGNRITHAQFCTDVANLANDLQRQPHHNYALYYQAAYPFAVALFALLHADKQSWIPGNNLPATAEKLKRQGCHLLGEWQGREILPKKMDNRSLSLTELDSQQPSMTIFTSGSDGQPKAINKSLSQLQNELDALEQQWGRELGNSQLLATVSHQHIYGLLFRLLWPLASARCFHSSIFLSPETLLKSAAESPSCWVASPAQLKRLDECTDWSAIASLKIIFSSGGDLPVSAATRIKQLSGQSVVEIYGSSETGGIGWRQQLDTPLWTPFPTIRLEAAHEGGRMRLYSAYLPNQTAFVLDDNLTLQSNGRFVLSGRRDRIVKVEEKRLSLNEMEQTLNQSNWITQSHVLLPGNKRNRVAAVIVLSAAGQAFLQQQHRTMLIKQLRKELRTVFEPVVLPRQWLIMQTLPISTQGKIETGLLRQLLILDSTKFPHIHALRLENNQAELAFQIPQKLIYFRGHFPQQPILPGITELAWVEKYGRLLFSIHQPFLRLEVIKFKKIIRPNDILTLQLHWKAETGKLYFEFNSATEAHSSGRMVYEISP